MYVDAHCHCHEFPEEEINSILRENDIILVIVSENLESSKKTISLSEKFEKVIPCIGLHPWEIKGEISIVEADKIIEQSQEIGCFGEVGLDRRFNRKNYNYQKMVFIKFVEAAKKGNKVLNIHALDAWEETIEIVHDMGVKKAIFHWYSGPVKLLEKIREYGYFITINPSVKFQKKHGAVLKNAPLDIILTESDGPYEYKGNILHPKMVPNLVNYIAEVKKLSREEVLEIIIANFGKLFQ
ncbi:MAG: TatD family hydrolase [Candidatus Njordarchaeia archaeon]